MRAFSAIAMSILRKLTDTDRAEAKRKQQERTAMGHFVALQPDTWSQDREADKRDARKARTAVVLNPGLAPKAKPRRARRTLFRP